MIETRAVLSLQTQEHDVNPTIDNPPLPNLPASELSAATGHPRARYDEPGWFSRNVMDRLVRRLTLAGISVWGARELRVRGRSSGEWRSVPVNPLQIDQQRYLVAPRGETQWVRNLRVAGGGELRVGRTVEPFAATEMTDDDKGPILRAYLERWAFEVGAFFDGVDGGASAEELARIAPNHPVFRIAVLTGAGAPGHRGRP